MTVTTLADHIRTDVSAAEITRWFHDIAQTRAPLDRRVLRAVLRQIDRRGRS